MKEKTKLLWVDPDHLNAWQTTIDFLRSDELIIDTLTRIDHSEILDQLEGRNGFILHCGTQHPIDGLSNLLTQIKEKYPKIKIILETNAKHPSVENIVDDYITPPIRPTILLLQLLNLFMLEEN